MKKPYKAPEMEEILLSNAVYTHAILNSIADEDTGDDFDSIRH